ncbi:hypothetical protein ACOCEA_17515 [Maribacter sp. CXY002]|uniref:hypothetical protein n=1 Tax=Maribacter luteocoastalis TaxID=3407671 RepID=UPI003B678897
MDNYRKRPKDLFIFDAEWQDLYKLTEQWKSDLLFYKDDLTFLKHLIDNYFIWILKKENIDIVKELDLGLIEMEGQAEDLLVRINTHLHHIAELLDNPFAYDSHTFRTEHELLEDDISYFAMEFKRQRKEVLKITDYLIDTEEFLNKLKVGILKG